MLVVAPIVVGAIGILVERAIIRWLYGRMIDTMLATWGLSLFLVGLTTADLRQHHGRPLGAARGASRSEATG